MFRVRSKTLRRVGIISILIIQDGGCRYVYIQKTTAFFPLNDQIYPKLIRKLQIQCKTHKANRITSQLSWIEMAAVAFFNFRKVLSYLYLATKPHQILWQWATPMYYAYGKAKYSTAVRSRNVGCHYLSLRKNISNSALVHQFDYTRLECCEPDVEVASVCLVLCMHGI